jgi:hypothetical protein
VSTIVVKNSGDRDRLIRLLQAREVPYTVNLTKGAIRSIEQNRLQRLWLNEAAEQGDHTAEEYRAYCKLTLGVPILRAENEEFAEQYDRLVKPLPYETKLQLMMEPIDFPVTRLMTSKQKSTYLDQMFRLFEGMGFRLTDPEWQGRKVA